MKYIHLSGRHRLRTVALVLVIILSLIPAPLWQGRAAAFTVGEEKEVGEQLLAIVRKEFKIIDDPDISQYINRVGSEMLRAAGPQYFDYHFFVINNKEFNAFAAPSGLIFIHSGLIETMDTEGELLSVIAHEIGHVASRHIANRLNRASKINVGTAALILAGIVMGGGPLSEALVTGSMAANTTLNLKFSRQDEEEADRLAFKYMRSQGRDPEAMEGMLRKMYRISRYSRGNVPAYLLTHPEPERRLNYVQDLLLMKPGGEYRKEDEFAFRRMKYRVLALTKDATTLLPALERKAADESIGEDERVMASFGVSQVRLAMADFAGAEKALRRVMARYPGKPILTTDLGVIFFESGRYDEALALFREARRADADCAYTTYQLARCLQQMGEPADSLRLYEELLAALPDNAGLHYQIGRLKAQLGDPGTGYYHLGVYHWYVGDPETAKFHLRKAIETLPPNDPYHKKAQAMLDKIATIEKNR